MSFIKKYYHKFINIVNKSIFNISKLLTINENLIVLESEGDFTDNSEALFNYMKKNGFLKNIELYG